MPTQNIESEVEDFLMGKYFPKYMNEEEIKKEATEMAKHILKSMIPVKKEVLSAKRRIPNWNGSNLETKISSIYDNPYDENFDDYGVGWTVETFVGSTFMTHLSPGILGDVAEDHQDFSSESEMEDYQNLVSEIQDPNSTRREKTLTLYTAQPSGFDRKKERPKG